jgi:hypothetical protein
MLTRINHKARTHYLALRDSYMSNARAWRAVNGTIELAECVRIARLYSKLAVSHAARRIP